MPMTLEGSCRCGSVRFSIESHTPYPYQRCYCSICRKTAGGGGYTINIMGDAKTLKVEGEENIAVYRAKIDRGSGCEASSGRRHFCSKCASALYLTDPNWPELAHPFASVIDTGLPTPPESVHLLLKDKASWIVPQVSEDDRCFDEFPDESIEAWHKARGLWID